jgi:hypothetical protein
MAAGLACRPTAAVTTAWCDGKGDSFILTVRPSCVIFLTKYSPPESCSAKDAASVASLV